MTRTARRPTTATEDERFGLEMQRVDVGGGWVRRHRRDAHTRVIITPRSHHNRKARR